MPNTLPKLLIAAAYDPSGGAGVLADTRAAQLMRTSATACLTALTIQSSRRLEAVIPLSGAVLDRQLKRLAADGPTPDAVKIGALAAPDQLRILSRFLVKHSVPAVYDPVVSPTRGEPFIEAKNREKFRQILHRDLLPRLTLVTPNWLEYQWIFGSQTPELASAVTACAILVKGGHQASRSGTVTDRLYQNGKLVFTHSRPRVKADIHGTGCILASMIAAGLAHRWTLIRAVQVAEKRMNNLIRKAGKTRPGTVVTLLS